MTVSVPASSAAFSFSSSPSMEELTGLLPRFAFTFVVSARPIPHGRRLVLRWRVFAGITSRPAASSSRTRLGSMFSALATDLTSGEILPDFAICSCVVIFFSLF